MSKDLITLDEFKAYKNISSTDDDVKIRQIIKTVSSLVRQFCNREFTTYYSTPKVELHKGNTPVIYLNEFPVINVSLVETSDDRGETFTTIDEFTDYIVDLEEDAIKTVFETNFTYDGIANTVRVTYTAGYETPPEDLKQAVMDIVEYYREEEYIPKKTMAGATSDNEVFRLMRSERFPIHIQRILNLYRVVV